ncbi:uncharacterized protein [Prorops nasuta]|uniref:uncharacterized protein n=1 Tax=Prorops nasuta TaxID=863751 RepID=UPI0034CE9DBE
MPNVPRTPPSTDSTDSLIILPQAGPANQNESQPARMEQGLSDCLLDTAAPAFNPMEQLYSVGKHVLTPFMNDAPDLWFIMVEAEFDAARITADGTKYSAVLRALDRDTLTLLTDVLRKPSPKDKYLNLKEAIINRVAESRTKQVDKLLTNLVLGDRKPSQLLREMRDLAKSEVSDDILHQLWLERLPAHMRPHLLTSSKLNLEAVAEIADRIIDTFQSSYVLAASKSTPGVSNCNLERKIDDLQALILTCMQEIKDLKAGHKVLLETQLIQGQDVWREVEQMCRTMSTSCDLQETYGKLVQPSLTGVRNSGEVNQISKELRLFVHDKQTNAKYLIDSGSAVSIIPANRIRIVDKKDDLVLYAANASEIPTFGRKTLKLDLNLRRDFIWTFIIAEVPMAIIGADFLTHYNVIIDLKNQRLIDGTTKLTSKGEILETSHHSVSTIHSGTQYSNLLNKYISVTQPSPKVKIGKTNFAHRIITTCQPVSQKFRRLFGEKAVAARREIQQLLDMGALRPSNSPWASPIHLVKKKDGSYRMCGDYRGLNAATVHDSYPPPLIHDVFPMLQGKTIFSTIDLERAFHQIPMHEEDIGKTAITTPWGLYEYLVMPFGLKNATQTFQRYINHIFRDLEFVFIYVDDILVMSDTEQQHQVHLEKVFERLQQNNFTVNLQKCNLGKK